jgi:hypothetical protein
MALQIPGSTPLRGFAEAVHAIKQDLNFDQRASEMLTAYDVIDNRATVDQVKIVFEVTANKMIEAMGAAVNVPITDVRFRISFNLDGARLSVDSNNVSRRLAHGNLKKEVRQQLEALLRPVLERALRPYQLPNGRAIVTKLEKAIALEYINLISDKRIDLILGKDFTIERI